METGKIFKVVEKFIKKESVKEAVGNLVEFLSEHILKKIL